MHRQYLLHTSHMMIYCMHANFKLHSGTLPSNFTTILKMAVRVTLLGENTVSCHTTSGTSLNYNCSVAMLPIPLVKRSKAWVCSRLFAGIVGSNPIGGMDVCLLWVLCTVKYRSLQWADHLFRGVLPGVCLNCVRSRNLKNEAAKAWIGLLRHRTERKKVSPYHFACKFVCLLCRTHCLRVLLQ
jgi:hypothetical protein